MDLITPVKNSRRSFRLMDKRMDIIIYDLMTDYILSKIFSILQIGLLDKSEMGSKPHHPKLNGNLNRLNYYLVMIIIN